MLIKTGDGKILDVIKDNDDKLDDDKTRKALRVAKNLVEDGNKTESTVEAEKSR